MANVNTAALLAALQQLNAAPQQQQLAQQLYGNGQRQLAAGQDALTAKTPSVGGVAGRESPFQAIGNGLQAGAGLQQQILGRQQEQAAAQQQQQGQMALQQQLAQLLRQQGAQSGSDGDLDPGVSGDAMDDIYGAFGG